MTMPVAAATATGTAMTGGARTHPHVEERPVMDADAAFSGGTIDVTPGNNVPGIQTGGRAADGTPDTRGILEKTADTVTGDRTDDKTGKSV